MNLPPQADALRFHEAAAVGIPVPGAVMEVPALAPAGRRDGDFSGAGSLLYTQSPAGARRIFLGCCAARDCKPGTAGPFINP